MNKIFSHHILPSNAIITLIYKKWLMRERRHETGFRWKGFSLGKVNGNGEGERGDQLLGTGAAEKKTEAEREEQTETERKRERWRWAGPF